MTDQRHLTLRVAELLDASATAHAAGDKQLSLDLAQQASELDPLAYVGIVGGITIGEIPHPEREPLVWAEWLQNLRGYYGDDDADG